MDGIRVEWYRQDEEYVATHPDFPSLSWLAPTAQEARRGLQALLVGENDGAPRPGDTRSPRMVALEQEDCCADCRCCCTCDDGPDCG